LANPHHC